MLVTKPSGLEAELSLLVISPTVVAGGAPVMIGRVDRQPVPVVVAD